MLTNEQISEIREHLEKAQNPVFFFDNDCDGLMAFILLRRFIDRGRGVAIKSFPELDESYTQKIEEFGADYVFILDKPQVSKAFLEAVENMNLPVVWIDHHNINIKINGKNIHAIYQSPEDLQNNIKKQDKIVLNAIKGVVAFGEDNIIGVLI